MGSMSNTTYEARAGAGDESDYASAGDFFALLKPRVMSLVVFTGLVGVLIAPGSMNPVLAAVAVLCIAVGSGAAGAINMWYDRDIDAIMARTRHRPIPAGRIEPGDALGFGVVLSVASVTIMGLMIDGVAAALLALAILFYVFVYTIWLKRRTPQNIVIGGAAGAFPPMIGWAAATGAVTIESLALFALIFLWTPPHFWALSLYRCDDYKAAGVPMLPVVAGKTVTRWQMLIYTILLLPVSLAPTLLGIAGWIYGSLALVLGLGFVAAAVAVLRADGDGPAKRMFGYSIFYLAALFALLVVDRAPVMTG